MNIGVLGWWRASNQGDFAIRENLERALAPHRVVPIDLPFHLTRDELERLNLLDFLILGGGGLFQDAPPIPFDAFDEWGARLTTPIGALGVGIDRIALQHRPAVQALVEQACFFYVRDRESQELVQHPRVRVAPDLSFLYPFPRSASGPSSRPLPVCGVNLRAVPSLDVGRWIEALRRLPVRLRGIPFSTFSACREIQTLRQLDADCPAVFDPGLYQGLDLMVGTAFHSAIFAIQASIPTIAIAGTLKVRRLFADLGLDEWLLGMDDWDELPELVQRALECKDQLAGRLQGITANLMQAARETLAVVKQEIERVARPHTRSRRRVSIVVAGSASEADNRRTLASCLDQTYESLEITFVGDGLQVPQLPAWRASDQLVVVSASPAESLADRLNRALAGVTGVYVSWVAAGSYYAPDAISCMAARLEETDCDMVFADYYTLHEADYIANARSVDSAYKLFRGNVIGPCFLFRRELSQSVGSLRSDTPCADYDFWLRAGQSFRLQPIHARLFFAPVSDGGSRDRELERQVRRQWRSAQPWLWRVFWRFADTGLVERYLVRPLMTVLRKAGAISRRDGSGNS